MEGEKRCTRCMFLLPYKEFSKNRKSSDGYTFWCKICHEQQREEQKLKKKEGHHGNASI